MNVLRETKYFTEKEVMVTEKVYNDSTVTDVIKDYLENNKISGDKYRLTNWEVTEMPSLIIELEREGAYAIDEDFEEDLEWNTFLNVLAKDLEVLYATCPWYYYPK
jgi:hypothetical protein